MTEIEGLYPEKAIEAYHALSAFIVTGSREQPPSWPLSVITINQIHRKFFPNELYTTIKALEKKGLRDKEICSLLWGPTALTYLLYLPTSALGRQTSTEPLFDGCSAAESRAFIEKVIDYIALIRKGDPYCRDHKNILLTERDVEKELAMQRFFEVSENPELASIVHTINAVLFNYCLLIHVGGRGFSQEYHGPYGLGNGKSLLIRDYFNLKPSEVWPFAAALPFDTFSVFEIYQDVDIRLDLFNHYWHSKPPAQSLSTFALSTDGRALTASEIQELFESCKEVMKEGILAVRRFSAEEWITKMIEMRYHWLKPAKTISGKNWKPPSDVLTLAHHTIQAIEEPERRPDQPISPSGASSSTEAAIETLQHLFLAIIYQQGQKTTESENVKRL